MKETTKEIIDRTKGITELRMTLGHLTTLAAVIAEQGSSDGLQDLMEQIEGMAKQIETACLKLISN